MSSKVKKSRKELLHEPDEFLVLSARLLKLLRTYQQQALFVVVGIFAILATVAVVRFVASSNEDKASRMWAEVKATYQSVLQEKDAEQALAAVEAPYAELFDKYGSKQTGKLARLNYGQICLAAGKADAALPHFEAALKAFGDDPAWRELALAGLAHALAQTGKHAEAAARFEEIVASGASVLKAEALYQLGWLYVQAGDSEKGKSAHQRLVEDYPNSSYTQIVREKLAG
jgi:hypothetical protein